MSNGSVNGTDGFEGRFGMFVFVSVIIEVFEHAYSRFFQRLLGSMIKRISVEKPMFLLI